MTKKRIYSFVVVIFGLLFYRDLNYESRVAHVYQRNTNEYMIADLKMPDFNSVDISSILARPSDDEIISSKNSMALEPEIILAPEVLVDSLLASNDTGLTLELMEEMQPDVLLTGYFFTPQDYINNPSVVITPSLVAQVPEPEIKYMLLLGLVSLIFFFFKNKESV